jgi:hypothetical protein
MTIQQATEKYEAWLARRIRVEKEDLNLKHNRMREGPFSFLRATFYRWMQRWPELCPGLAKAPAVLSVGDLHVENFGTWRDAEGRLIWGINDFDEAFELPFTHDLVRLAASALLAVKEKGLAIDPEAACDAILEGYTEGFAEGGRPFVLSEHNRWLRDLVTNKLRDPVLFWEKVDGSPGARGAVPAEVLKTFKLAMPEPGLSFRVVHREAGLGSLGRPRFAAIAEWRGGKIAREVKALLVSACVWETKSVRAEIQYEKIIKGAVRAVDPFVGLRNHWLLRRLSPYCSRLELRDLPRHKEEEKLLRAMGWETANIHLGSRASGKAVMRDLKKRDSQWLRQAAKLTAEAVRDDWKKWVS